MKNQQKNPINRRDFLKILTAGTGAAALAACSNKSSKTNIEAIANQEPAKGQMTYRENPNNGDKVSILGYGMMRLPALDGESAKTSELGIDQEQVNRLVDYAIEHGVNYFDTAPVYCKGKSEAATGIALKKYPRNSYFLATKLSNFKPDTWGREESMTLFENSLKNLQTDYVDYLLLHGIGMGEDGYNAFFSRYIDNGILDWLVEQKQKGRIRNLGFSYHGDIRAYDLLLKWHDEGKYHWDFVQIEDNYLEWECADKINKETVNSSYLYNELAKRNIPVIIMEPLLGGRLSNVPDPIAEELQKREPNRSVASWAFRYVGTQANVLTVLSGMTYMEHLKDNLLSYCPLEPLTEEEMKFLDTSIAQQMVSFEPIPCNACNYCMPCPYGVDIPAIFTHFNKVKNEARMPLTKVDKNYAKQRKAFLVGYQRTAPRLHDASRCIGCGQCMEHCPQAIRIPEEMQKIDKFVQKLQQEELV